MAYFHSSLNKYFTETKCSKDFRDNLFHILLRELNCERDTGDYVPYIMAVPISEIPEIIEFVSQFEFEDQKLYKFEFKGHTFHFTTVYATRHEKESFFSSYYYKEQYRLKCEELNLNPDEANKQVSLELWEELFPL